MLLDEGVLTRAGAHTMPSLADGGMVQPSPLPASACARPRTWAECGAITAELAGRSIEQGYLELFVPIFRVAHVATDADGRQVGEANVFPRALRLDTPTTWLRCSYAGTRHMADKPMNVTALKAMRLHWKQMMAALLRIRAAFLRRFPDAAAGWTVGRVERLATLVLAVPTYQIARADRPFVNGSLHPALSSLFRVTDGLRMTMHQMLFVPIGEPALSPDVTVTSAQILDYAERNYSFFSETGVCAGPRHMVESFLRTLIDGQGPDGSDTVVFDAGVEAALADIEPAFDYGLLGLQSYATLFSLWPAMTRAYERLSVAADAAVADRVYAMAQFRDRIGVRVQGLKAATFLATEEWRGHREQVYADMYDECGRGLTVPHTGPGLVAQLAPRGAAAEATAALALASMLTSRFGSSPSAARHVDAMHACLMGFFVRTQAILRAASDTQQRINALLGRPQPRRAFTAADANMHHLVQGSDPRRLPYLLDELRDALGIDVAIDADRIEVVDRQVAAPRHVTHQDSAGMGSAD